MEKTLNTRPLGIEKMNGKHEVGFKNKIESYNDEMEKQERTGILDRGLRQGFKHRTKGKLGYRSWATNA